MVGNIICLEGGTGALARTRRQIMTFVDVDEITVDANVATGTGITGKVGGALATLGEAMRNAVAGNDFWATGSESVASNTQNIATGKVNLPAGASTSNFTRLTGYSVTRGDGGRYTFTNAVAGTNDMITCTTANGRVKVENIAVDCNSIASVGGIVISSACFDCPVVNCKASNGGSSDYGVLNNATRGTIVNCEATGCAGTAGIGAGALVAVQGCYSHDNTCDGFQAVVAAPSFSYCISESNSGAGSDGFSLTVGSTCSHCTAYNNGQHGFNLGTSASETFFNCNAYGNVGWGWNIASAQELPLIVNCAGGDNDSGNYDTTKIATHQVYSFIALSADPFVDAAGGDFTLTDVTPGGKDLQSSGAPQTYPGSASTRGRPTIGAAPKGGGGIGPGQPIGGGGGHVIGS